MRNCFFYNLRQVSKNLYCYSGEKMNLLLLFVYNENMIPSISRGKRSKWLAKYYKVLSVNEKSLT